MPKSVSSISIVGAMSRPNRACCDVAPHRAALRVADPGRLLKLAVQEGQVLRVDVRPRRPAGSSPRGTAWSPSAALRARAGTRSRARAAARRGPCRQDQPARLAAGIGGVADAVLERAVGRLAGLLQAAAAHVVEPAVVQAAQPARLAAAVAQVDAAVRAVQAEQAGSARVVAEQHQLLTQQPDRQRRTARRQLLRQRHGLPVAAQ